MQKTIDLKNRRFVTFWSRFKRHRMALVGGIIIFLFIFVALVVDVIMPHNPYKHDLRHRLERPSKEYLFGKDDLGRCILSRIIYGTRISLVIAASSIGIGLSIGVLIGAVAGYYPELDGIIMRVIDVMLAFPSMFLALAIMSALGTGLNNVIIAVGIYSVPTFCRVTRGVVLSVKENEYIE